MSDNDSSQALLDIANLAGLDDEDKARLLTSFAASAAIVSSPWHYVRASEDGCALAYVFDDESGMVYILD
jgi:hypothetical protein